MSDSSTSASTGKWRLLILDRDQDDPKWVMATVMTPEDVHPAYVIDDQYTGWDEMTAWLRGVVGLDQARLVPLRRPEVWSIE
jgi:hypothetical protein